MPKVLILGAGGQIAQNVIELLKNEANVQLSLFLRDKRKLGKLHLNGVEIIEGDVLDDQKLREVMQGQDLVYANLDGELDKLAKSIVEDMKFVGLKRLIFITSLGIYNEVPGAFGKWNNRMIGKYLPTYAKAADIIERSGLDYTIIRPAWLTDYDEIDYELTQKGEPFRGTEVSRKSVASLIVKIIKAPKSEMYKSLGINKPGTDGDKPAFY